MTEEEQQKTSQNEASGQPTLCDRSIWCFYKWAAILAPLALMLSHWYIFYVFSQNPQELLMYSKQNEICIAWIYSILYLVVPVMLLPASYFFKKCDLFRIPFVYFIFINIERYQYGSWFCTNEMIETHFILIKCIIGIYGFELLGLILSNLSYVCKIGKLCIDWVRKKIKEDELTDEEADEIISLLEETVNNDKNKNKTNKGD